MISASLQTTPIEVQALLDDWRTPPAAAESQFIGRMRSTASDGRRLDAMDLEHYPGMTEKRLLEMATELRCSHDASSILVRHRIGHVLPGEVLVLIVVRANHRGPAQQCCQDLLERIKWDAPLWKREWIDGRGRWLETNTPLNISSAAPGLHAEGDNTRLTAGSEPSGNA